MKSQQNNHRTRTDSTRSHRNVYVCVCVWGGGGEDEGNGVALQNFTRIFILLNLDSTVVVNCLKVS